MKKVALATAALIILVAHLQRTMWKYSHPMTYRAVLIEAGHIAQNIMIVASAGGLSTVPTAALGDTLLEKLLGLNRVMQAVTCGNRGAVRVAAHA